MGDVAVAGKVGNGGVLGCEERPRRGEVAVHEGEQPPGDGLRAHRVGIWAHVPQRDCPCRRRAKGQFARGDGQPALHRGRRLQRLRQPMPVGIVALGQVHQDGVAVGEHEAAILQHRYLPKRVQRQEGGRGPHRRGRVTVGVGQAEHPQQQLHPVRVTGQLGAVQGDGGIGHEGSPLLHPDNGPCTGRDKAA